MASLFTKILNGEIPGVKVYEDEKSFAILDINPNTKGHCLVVPKEEHKNILDCPREVLQHIIAVAKALAEKQVSVLGCDGVNIGINNNEAAGQEIEHIHIHVIPRYSGHGFGPFQGHEKYGEGEMEKYGSMLRIE